MQYSAIVAAALIANVSATKYTTKVVSAYTTYCPEATTLTHGSSTYTVTEVSHLAADPEIRIERGGWMRTLGDVA